MLPILADPSHDEHADRRAWLGLADGETWDPKQFDVDVVNQELARMR